MCVTYASIGGPRSGSDSLPIDRLWGRAYVFVCVYILYGATRTGGWPPAGRREFICLFWWSSVLGGFVMAVSIGDAQELLQDGFN